MGAGEMGGHLSHRKWGPCAQPPSGGVVDGSGESIPWINHQAPFDPHHNSPQGEYQGQGFTRTQGWGEGVRTPLPHSKPGVVVGGTPPKEVGPGCLSDVKWPVDLFD